ncbi:MAG: hypothetical protein A2014_12320 [Spirochaetes bacterium GWF1_49_6]|nr:MAG: hypothetical protein A2014_12320 [Spirochaetes bacterium GWF1_49_6]
MTAFIIVIGVVICAGGIAVLFVRSLKSAALITGVVSLIAALLFVLMKAFDVAITEAAIGAVLSTALYFFALRRLEEDGYKSGKGERDEN